MVRKNFNPGPEHGQFNFDTPESQPEVTTPSMEEYDKSVGRIYISEIRRMLNEGVPQEEVLEVINERIKALGAKPVEASVERDEAIKEHEVKEVIISEINAAQKYDKEFSELVSEIFDQIERNYPSGDMALAEAQRKARQKLGARPAENINLEVNPETLESKWLTYFKKPTLLSMLNAASKLNMASGREVQGIVYIDNPSATIKKRGSDIYRPIEAEVKYLVSRGILNGNVKDLSVEMYKDFMKDFGGREYGGAIYHPRNTSLRETMDSLSGRIYKLKQSLKNTTNPVDIASTKDFIKDLTAKKKAILSTIAKSMSDTEKAEHEAYKNRTKLKKSLNQ